MSNPNNSPTARYSSNRYPAKTNPIQVGYLVALVGRHGLHEVLEVHGDGRCAFRALNLETKPLIYAYGDEVTDFTLPIYHCFAALNRGEIVALVNGPDFDVVRDASEFAAPLFQAVHAEDLIQFAQLALGAGFMTIDLTNGYMSWEGTIQGLIEECVELAAASPA